MVTADQAVETLRLENQGVYKETRFGSCVRQFTPIKNLPKYPFKLEAPLRNIDNKQDS